MSPPPGALVRAAYEAAVETAVAEGQTGPGDQRWSTWDETAPESRAAWTHVVDAVLRAAENDGEGGMVLVPLEPPDSIPAENYGEFFDDELFDLSRNGDYQGLYRALIRRARGRSKEA